MLTSIDPIQLIETQVETLYQVDDKGRLLYINQSERPPAPLFFLGRTSAGNIWRFRHDVPTDIQTVIDQLCQAEDVTSNFTQPPRQYATIKHILSQHRPIQNEWRGPAYAFPDDFTYPGRSVLLTEANLHLLQGPLAHLRDPGHSMQPCVAIIEQDQVVSLCWSSRLSAQAAEAGVETLPEFRGRGYASAVVAGWAKAVQQSGCRPLYSTSWDNVASQNVANKLGLGLYGEDCSFSE